MAEQTVEVDERVELIGEVDSGTRWTLEVSGGDISVYTSRNEASDGPRILDGDVSIVGVPAGDSLWAFGQGDSDATVVLSRASSDQFFVNTTIRSDMSISGDVDADVTDRAAREVGKVRLEESGGTLIDPATSGDVTGEQPREVATWSAGSLPETPNASGVNTDDVTGDGSFAAQTIPDGFALAVKSDPDNADTAYVDGFPLGPAEGVTLWVDNFDVPAFTFDDQSDTVHAIVEAP